MTHNFTTLTSVLGRCSAKVADQVIAEIRSAINDAAQQGTGAPSADLAEVSAAVHRKKTEQAAERKAKAAERKAQKTAEKEAAQAAGSAERSESPHPTPAAGSAERSESPRCISVAVASRLAAGSGKLSGAEAPDDVRCESCGVASRLAAGSVEAEQPVAYFTLAMVKYLRRCPDKYMLAVLNSYFHLIFTGNLVHTADDHRYLDNFITLTRTVGLIDNPEPPTAFLLDNPALPLPRAQRRAIERMRRKQLRHASHLKC